MTFCKTSGTKYVHSKKCGKNLRVLTVKRKLLKKAIVPKGNPLRLNRKYKRKYLIEKQNSLEEKLMASNQKDFWKSIGKLGISIERNQSIPWSVIDNEGTVQTDKNVVLGQ